MSKTIEYRVRPVKRYIVTRYETSGPDENGRGGASCDTLGEFDREELAINLAALLTVTEPGAIMLDGFGMQTDAAFPQQIVAGWQR